MRDFQALSPLPVPSERALPKELFPEKFLLTTSLLLSLLCTPIFSPPFYRNSLFKGTKDLS